MAKISWVAAGLLVVASSFISFHMGRWEGGGAVLDRLQTAVCKTAVRYADHCQATIDVYTSPIHPSIIEVGGKDLFVDWPLD